MIISNVHDGLTILRPYFEGDSQYQVLCETGVLFVAATHTIITPEDVAKLRQLRWYQWFLGPDAPYDKTHNWCIHL